jgi:hypothetical protein
MSRARRFKSPHPTKSEFRRFRSILGAGSIGLRLVDSGALRRPQPTFRSLCKSRSAGSAWPCDMGNGSLAGKESANDSSNHSSALCFSSDRSLSGLITSIAFISHRTPKINSVPHDAVHRAFNVGKRLVAENSRTNRYCQFLRASCTSISTSAPGSTSPATRTVERAGKFGCSFVPKNRE